jgi:hypothetical protein
LNRIFRASHRLAAAFFFLALTTTIGAQPSAELEAGLRALIAPRDLAKADAAVVELKAARLGLGSAERRLAAYWQLWFNSGSSFEGDFDRAAFKAAYDAVKAAEAKALSAARAFMAEAKKARAFPERSKQLLFAYDQAISMDHAWRIREADKAALRQESVDEMLAAALGPGIGSYVAASHELLGRAAGGRDALAAFAAAWAAEPEEGLYKAAFGVATAYGPAARFIASCVLRGDALGYLAVRLSLMREIRFLGLSRSSGLGEAELRTVAEAARPALAPSIRAPSDEDIERALGLYASWQSASLRAQSDEPAAFARLSAAYGADEALRASLGTDGSPDGARLKSRRDAYWLRAEEALASDLRAELLAWLRSSGYAASTPRLSLKVTSQALAGSSLAAAVELELLVDGERYYPPYGALKASIEASLRTVFGGELPAYAFVERLDALRYAYRGPGELALRAELLKLKRGEAFAAAESSDASATIPGSGDAMAASPSWSVSAWMATRLGEPAVAALARSYGAAVEAAARTERSR